MMSQIKTAHSIEKLEQSLLDSINLILKTTGDSADESTGESAVFNVGLSGGSIISILANILPRLQTDLSRWRFYFCDERVVPVESADSTYGAYLKQFADQQIAVERGQFVKINEQLPLEECAQQYTGLIEEGVPKNSDGVPAFDLLFLGMGPDGHTCSLFPNHPALEVNDKLVTHVDDSPKPPPQRITFTYKLLNSAKNVIFLATGKAKQTIVREIFIEGKDYPASRVKARNVIWFLDNDSSALLPTQFTT